MLESLTFYEVLGMPLIVWGGIVTLLCLITTSIIGTLNMRGCNKPPITLKGHKVMAGITIILGIAHALLGMLAYF